jgi:hypothetical protein
MLSSDSRWAESVGKASDAGVGAGGVSVSTVRPPDATVSSVSPWYSLTAPVTST